MAAMATVASLTAVPLGVARSRRTSCRAVVIASSRPVARKVASSRFRDITKHRDTTLGTLTRVSPRRRSRCTTAFAFSDDDAETPGGRWRVFCRRLESRVEAPSLKRLVLWVGENPLPAVVGTVAVSWTAATIASALALQLAFSMLSVVLPVVFFATVGVPAMLVFGGVLVFGVLLPAASFALFAVGGSVLATISTVLPIVAFLGAVALGSNLVDVLLPNEVEEEDGFVDQAMVRRGERNEGNKGGGDGVNAAREKSEKETEQTTRDPDLSDFDRRLLGDPAKWTNVDVDRWLLAEGLQEWRTAFALGGVEGPGLVKIGNEKLKRLGVADESARVKILGALKRLAK